eukprot:COSAG06_NODE_27591_length_590_cov_0.879837_1_plen_106_part_10
MQAPFSLRVVHEANVELLCCLLLLLCCCVVVCRLYAGTTWTRAFFLPEGWLAAIDPASGALYYQQPSTGLTSWEPPEGSSETPLTETTTTTAPPPPQAAAAGGSDG